MHGPVVKESSLEEVTVPLGGTPTLKNVSGGRGPVGVVTDSTTSQI